MSLFVSYTRADEALVRSIREDLERLGRSVWMDHQIHGGESWWREIIREIQRADLFVFALSNHSWRSKPCRLELRYAERLGIPVLPLQVGALDSMFISLAERQIIDYRGRTADAVVRLVAALNELTAQPVVLPDPLPDPPEVPFEYLYRIAALMGPERISPEAQDSLIAQLRSKLKEEDDEVARADIVKLLRELGGRWELTVRNAREIDEILAGVTAQSVPAPDDGATRLPPMSQLHTDASDVAESEAVTEALETTAEPPTQTETMGQTGPTGSAAQEAAAGPAEETGAAAQAVVAEQTEPVGPAESGERTESSARRMPADQAEAAGRVEPAQRVESGGQTEPTSEARSTEHAATTEAGQPAEPTGEAEPAERAGAGEQTEPAGADEEPDGRTGQSDEAAGERDEPAGVVEEPSGGAGESRQPGTATVPGWLAEIVQRGAQPTAEPKPSSGGGSTGWWAQRDQAPKPPADSGPGQPPSGQYRISNPRGPAQPGTASHSAQPGTVAAPPAGHPTPPSGQATTPLGHPTGGASTGQSTPPGGTRFGQPTPPGGMPVGQAGGGASGTHATSPGGAPVGQSTPPGGMPAGHVGGGASAAHASSPGGAPVGQATPAGGTPVGHVGGASAGFAGGGSSAGHARGGQSVRHVTPPGGMPVGQARGASFGSAAGGASGSEGVRTLSVWGGVLGAVGIPFLVVAMVAEEAAGSAVLATLVLLVTVLGLSLGVVAAARHIGGARVAVAIASVGLLGALVYALVSFGAL